MAGFTRVQLREEIGRFFAGGNVFEDTATGGSTTSLVDSKLSRFGTDFFKGCQVYVKTDAGGAAPQGQSSYCTAFATATGTLTFSPAMTAAPAAGDTYQIYSRVTKQEIDTALGRVCKGAHALGTLTPSAASLDYALSSLTGILNPQQVIAVWWRWQANSLYDVQPLNGWKVFDNAGALTLRLPETLTTGDSLWLEYLIGESGMTADTDTINLPMSLVKASALVYLIENKLVGQDQSGLDRWGTLLREWRDVLTREQRKHQAQAGRVQMMNWDGLRGNNRVLDLLGLGGHYGGSFDS